MKKVTVFYKAKPNIKIIYRCDFVRVLEGGDLFELSTRLIDVVTRHMETKIIEIPLETVNTITIEHEDN